MTLNVYYNVSSVRFVLVKFRRNSAWLDGIKKLNVFSIWRTI